MITDEIKTDYNLKTQECEVQIHEAERPPLGGGGLLFKIKYAKYVNNYNHFNHLV